MKRILTILLIVLFLTGCGKKPNNNDNNKPQEKKENMVYEIETLNCSAFNNIKIIMSYNTFLTNDGQVYYIGNYSDGTNCKLISDDKNIKTIFGNEYLIDENSKMYSINYSDFSLEITSDISNYLNFIKVDKDIIKYRCTTNVCYLLKNDGKLYKAKINYKNNKAYLDILNDNVFPVDEKILDFDGFPNEGKSFDNDINWIRTDKSSYFKKINNFEECNKYDDVKCTYGLVKDEYLSSIISNIAFFQYWSYGEDDYCVTYITKDGIKYSDKKCYGG